MNAVTFRPGSQASVCTTGCGECRDTMCSSRNTGPRAQRSLLSPEERTSQVPVDFQREAKQSGKGTALQTGGSLGCDLTSTEYSQKSSYNPNRKLLLHQILGPGPVGDCTWGRDRAPSSPEFSLREKINICATLFTTLYFVINM